jgi:hypothetical protein
MNLDTSQGLLYLLEGMQGDVMTIIVYIDLSNSANLK